MSNIIGFITKVKGSASITLEDGTIKYLAIGDPIHEGEIIKTIGPDSSIQITFDDNRTLYMGGDETTLLDESVYDGEPFGDADVLAIQEALLSGEDFEFEDTAAGGEGGDGSGASDPYVAERTGGEGDYEPSGAPNFAGVAPFGTDDDTGGSPAEPAEPAEPDFGILEDTMVFLGQLEANDPGLVYSFAAGSEAPEGLTLNPDGSYAFDPSVEAYQYLAVGETLELPFTWVAIDPTGQETDPDIVTITITGTNDHPVVSDATSAGIETMDAAGVLRTADAMSLFDGTLPQARDLDAADTHSYHLVGGTIDVDSEAINPDMITDLDVVVSDSGEYAVTGNFNALAAGETATVTFQYVADDNQGFGNNGNLNENSVSEPATITLTVTGTNDQPVLSDVEQSQSGALEGNNTFTGDLNDATDDQDVNDTHTFNLVADSVDVESGVPVENFNFDFNPDGTYAVTGDFNLLAAGEEAVITFQYTADDNKGFDGLDGQNENSVSEPGTVTLTVTGTNDQPVVTDIYEYTPSAVREFTTTEENFEIKYDSKAILWNEDDLGYEKYKGNKSLINIEDSGTIKDLNVRVNLEHSNNRDLTIILKAPDGTVIHLSRWNGGSSDNYTNTYFDDEADKSVYQKNGPFEDSYRPQGSWSDFAIDREYYAEYTVDDLAAFDGIDMKGEWTLMIHDNNRSYSGQLLDWGLVITTTDETVLYESDTEQFTVFDGDLATAQDDDANDTHIYEIVEDSVEATSENIDPDLIKDLSVVVNPDGTYTVTGDFNAMAEGEIAFVSFKYTADDGTDDPNGDPSVSEPATVTLAIEGTTDAPVITIDTTAGDSTEETIKELQGGPGNVLKAQGTLSFEDLDFNDTHSVSFFRVYPSDEDPNESNLEGIFNCRVETDSTGAQTGELVWTYTIGNPILQNLDPAETYTQTYRITLSDGISGVATQDIVITMEPTAGPSDYSGDDTFHIAGNTSWWANIDTGDGNDTLTVDSNVWGTGKVNMGDGDDTLDVGLDITFDAEVDMGAGDDTLDVGRNITKNASVDMGDGNDTLDVGIDITDYAKVNMGDGNDTLDIGSNIRKNASVDMGEGDDTLDVGGNIWGKASVDMGAGNDTFNVGSDITSTTKVNMGEGDDTLDVGGNIAKFATVDMGDGNDTLQVDGNILDTATVDMGDGDDTLILTDNTIDLGSLSDNVDNVETIELGDSSTAQSINNISAEDVFDMTDNDNILTLEGDSLDTVDLDNTWTDQGNDTYTSTYNDGVIDHDVTIIIDGIDNIV